LYTVVCPISFGFATPLTGPPPVVVNDMERSSRGLINRVFDDGAFEDEPYALLERSRQGIGSRNVMSDERWSR